MYLVSMINLQTYIKLPAIKEYPDNEVVHWQAVVSFFTDGVQMDRRFRKLVHHWLCENFGDSKNNNVWNVRFDQLGIVHVYFAHKTDAVTAYFMLS